MKTKMKARNIFVSFLAITAVLFLVATVSAQELARGGITVTVDDLIAEGASVVSGDDVIVEVRFTSNVYASDVKVKVEFEGAKSDVSATSTSFDVEDGKSYIKRLTLKVPSDKLNDVLSDDLTLNVRIWNRDYETERDYKLRVQRPTYDAVVRLISTPQNIKAGDQIPVDIAVENVGYNDLKNVYVIARIPALGIEKASYFSNLVAIECDKDSNAVENYGVDVVRKCNEDNKDTAFGRLLVEVPYEAKSGLYNLEVEVINRDLSTTRTKQISVENEFSSGTVIVTSSTKKVSVKEDAEFSIVLVNPTNRLKVYRLVTESSGSLSSSVSDSVVAVPAGSSRTVTVTANAAKEGEYGFNLSVFSGEKLEQVVPLKVNAEGSSIASPVVILTIVLAIIFLVLLAVLIVLIGKKPQKSEEFGESYY